MENFIYSLNAEKRRIARLYKQAGSYSEKKSLLIQYKQVSDEITNIQKYEYSNMFKAIKSYHGGLKCVQL